MVRRAMEKLDAEQQEALCYIADVGVAVCSAALAVSVLQSVIGLS
jgi:hypothetical protein